MSMASSERILTRSGPQIQAKDSDVSSKPFRLHNKHMMYPRIFLGIVGPVITSAMSDIDGVVEALTGLEILQGGLLALCVGRVMRITSLMCTLVSGGEQ